jgi:hypothetical protein
MLFAPAQTTATGVLPSSNKSALMSMAVMHNLSINIVHLTKIALCDLLCSAPRCAPPMPPVTNTGIPAACAKIIVPATVVAPVKD